MSKGNKIHLNKAFTFFFLLEVLSETVSDFVSWICDVEDMKKAMERFQLDQSRTNMHFHRH